MVKSHDRTSSVRLQISIAFILAWVGIGNSLYLSYLHYKNHTDISFSSFCALSKSINCDTVSQSGWSIVFGLPLAIWGTIGYILFLIVLLHAKRRYHVRPEVWLFPVVLGLIFSIVSLYLGYVSATKIHAYCILCLLSYIISFLLFFLTFMIAKRLDVAFSLSPVVTAVKDFMRRGLNIAFIIVLICITFATYLYLPGYWKYTPAGAATHVETGITDEGNPWIGSATPAIVIHEYADYQCFQCSKMHQYMRQLIAEYPDKIQLVHHHFPMDHDFNPIVVPQPYHVGSGKMALLAIYAAVKDKFWEMNDALYMVGRTNEAFNTRTLAESTGIPAGELAAALTHPAIRKKLDHDIITGMKLRITGTPTYLINGKTYEGTIPAEILSGILKK